MKRYIRSSIQDVVMSRSKHKLIYNNATLLYTILDDGTINIDNLKTQADHRQKGDAAMLIEYIKDIADATHSCVTLSALTLDEDSMTQKQLEDWYIRHGFRIISTGIVTRMMYVGK